MLLNSNYVPSSSCRDLGKADFLRVGGPCRSSLFCLVEGIIFFAPVIVFRDSTPAIVAVGEGDVANAGCGKDAGKMGDGILSETVPYEKDSE